MDEILMLSNTDILACIILSYLLFLIKRNDFMGRKKTIRYLVVVALTLLTVVFEIVTNIFEVYSSENTVFLAYIINVFGFSLMYLIPLLLSFLYSDKVYRARWLCAIPAIVGILLCISSYWTHWIFYIDEFGVYHRGNDLTFIINIIIGIFGFIILLLGHLIMIQEYNRNERKYLWVIIIIVLGTTIAQVLNTKIRIMWGGIAIAELLYYVFLRELQLKFDPITNVRNRSTFENSFNSLIPSEQLYIMEFDVNNLKWVNDTYGHATGDMYLLRTAEILGAAFEECGTVYRIGGDEFAVIAENCSEAKFQDAKRKLQELVNVEKNGYMKNYYIASGYSQYSFHRHKTVMDCLKEADLLMYIDKENSKKNMKGI